MGSQRSTLRRAMTVAFLLIGVFIALTRSFHPDTDNTLWWALFDAAHLPLFVLVGWAILWSVPRRGPREVAWVVLSVGVIAAGTELAQLFVKRDASLGDLVWNVVGGALGVALGRAWLGSGAREDSGRPAPGPRSPLAIVLLGGVTVLLFGLAATPALRELRLLRHFQKALPRFGDFETALDLGLWHGISGSRLARSTAWAAHGVTSVSVTPGRGRSTGLAIDGRALDWSACDSLAFVVWNPAGPFSLTVAVNDDVARAARGRGGWVGRYEIPPGERAISVPVGIVAAGSGGRPLRVNRIRSVILYTQRARAPRGFLVDDVRVVPSRLTTRREPAGADAGASGNDPTR
jgi:VanZ family protein